MQDLETKPLDESSGQGVIGTPAIQFPVWSAWDILFLLAFSSFSVLLLAGLAEATRHVIHTRLPSVRWLLQGPEGIYLVLFQALLDGLILLFIYLTVTLKYNSAFFESIKWRSQARVVTRHYVTTGLALALAVVVASTVFPTSEEPPIEKLLRTPSTALLFGFLGVFVAPFVEEVVFRGFIYPVVERWAGTVAAVVTTALLFSAVHVSQLWGSWPAIVLITVVGFTLSIVRARANALLPSVIIHVSYNSTICLLFLIGVLVEGFPK